MDRKEEEEEDSPEQVEIMGEDRTIDPQDYIVVEGNE